MLDITDLGELNYIIGIQVRHDRTAHTISLNQTTYIHQILMHFGMCAPVSTPFAAKQNLSASQSLQTEEEHIKYVKHADVLRYLEIVGTLLYATQTRPNIQHTVGIVSQFGGNVGKPPLEFAKRILRHLKGTTQFKLKLGCNGGSGS